MTADCLGDRPMQTEKAVEITRGTVRGGPFAMSLASLRPV